MKTIRDAINLGVKSITLNNGTVITHLERDEPDAWAKCPPKYIKEKMT